MNAPKVKRVVGNYELGRTIGEGTFAKVKFARNITTGNPVAIKILDKEKVLKHKMAEQIRREIATMKRIKHPNVVRLYEVMGSKTKIYIVLEYVTGGELFDKIVHNGRMKEDEARKYFQQLINAVDYCHSRGVYHRDLKPENLLLDAGGNLKVSDFGLMDFFTQLVELPIMLLLRSLMTKDMMGQWQTCGHVALFYLYCLQILDAEFTCPPWMSFCVKRLMIRILDPNPMTRITIPEILDDEWFKVDYKPPVFDDKGDASLDDIDAVFQDSEEHHVTEKKEEQPAAMSAFELIAMSKGLNLENLFDSDQGFKRETRFTSKRPPGEIIKKK